MRVGVYAVLLRHGAHRMETEVDASEDEDEVDDD